MSYNSQTATHKFSYYTSMHCFCDIFITSMQLQSAKGSLAVAKSHACISSEILFEILPETRKLKYTVNSCS